MSQTFFSKMLAALMALTMTLPSGIGIPEANADLIPSPNNVPVVQNTGIRFCNTYSVDEVSEAKGSAIMCIDNQGRRSVIDTTSERSRFLKQGNAYVVRTTPVADLTKAQRRRLNIDEGGGGGSSVSTRNKDREDLDILVDQCGGFSDYAKQREKERDQLNDDIKRYRCSGSDCVNIDKLKADRDQALKDCRKDCLRIAVEDDKNACHHSKVFKRTADFCSFLTLNDKDFWLQDFLKKNATGQDECTTAINNPDPRDETKACGELLRNDSCASQITGPSFKCDQKDKIIAYDNAARELDELDKRRAALDGPTKKGYCNVSCGKDATAAWSNRDSHSLKCLIDIQSSCADAIDRAQARVDSNICVNCNAGNQQQGNTCLYGPCGGGVSKAAQIISAIGSIGVPIGLGIMNMSMYNRGLQACVAMYNSQVSQGQAVGLPPQNPNCGSGGFGMGGFMGGMGGGFPGMGGFGMGMPGMGGMGFPGMGGFGMGMPGMGGMGFPGMGGFGMGMPGIGINAGIGLGMGGFGMGMPGMGGMGFPGMGGFGMGMPGMGGMGMGMPGMGGMGFPGIGVNAGIGLGGGMGFPNVIGMGGMGGGFPGMGGFGMGMPGMMGMGGMGMNPMVGNMMASQQNAMGIQQQMMGYQSAMQEMAAQNMILQSTGMMGMGMGGQFGMGYPYFGMGGMGGGMGGMGVPGYAGGMYYPGMGNFGMGGMGGFGGMGGLSIPGISINAGLNLGGLGAGAYGGFGGMGGFGGFNPYMYGGGGCGVQMGIPCY